MKRLYLLVIGSNFFDKSKLHAFISGSPQTIPDWWHYLDTCYIFQSSLMLEQLQKQIVNQFPQQHFLIEEINPKRYAGWLPVEAWEWLSRYKGWTVVP